MEEGTDSVKIVRIEKTGEPLVSMRLGCERMNLGFVFILCVPVCLYLYMGVCKYVTMLYVCLSHD